MTPEKQTCDKLDKYGEWMCHREEGHEKNADRRAGLHWCFFNGVKYQWRGHQEAKPDR
jgi:hypothetical protein